MSLDAYEFIRRFLLHVLPDGFHRIRHYGLFANGVRADNIAKARALAGRCPGASRATRCSPPDRTPMPAPCPCCGGRMILIETFERGASPRSWRCAPGLEPIDSS